MKKFLAAATLITLAGSASAGIALLDGALQTSDGSEVNAYNFGTLSEAPKVLFVSVAGAAGHSFEEYANFSIDALSDVSGTANTYALTFGNVDLLDIDNLTIEVWDNTHPSGNTLFATFAGNNITNWVGTLGAGQYHIDISGMFGPNATGGQYSVALNAVPAVPEPETYALMLAGLGAVGFMARRRRTLQA